MNRLVSRWWMRGSVAAAVAAALFALGGSASNWPQFMGPNGDGTSPEKGLLRAWPAEGPKVLWTAPLGKGYGGAAVRDGKVYLVDRLGQAQDALRCLDAATGKEEWRFAYDAPGSLDHEGSRSTPAVSEKHVFVIGPFGHFHCLDRASHEMVWKKNLLEEFKATSPKWAITQSPLLYRELVIAAPLSEQAGLVALEQATGQERWRSGPVGPMAYASPKLVVIDGVEQFTIVNKNGAAGVQAANGKVLWTYPHPCKIPIPNVTVLDNGKLFVTGGYNAGSAIIQVSQKDGQWSVKELKRIDMIGGHCHPGLVHQGCLYLLCNTNERSDGMVCFDAEGNIRWQTKRDPFFCKGSSILTADGLIYAMDGRAGELHVVEPSPTAFKSLAKAKLLGGQEIWGPLALADGKLLMRDQSQLKCVQLKAD